MQQLHLKCWSIIFTGDYSAIKLCKFGHSTPPLALLTVTILPNFNWTVHVGNKLVSNLQFPARIESMSQLIALLNFVDKLKVCQGVQDQKFDPLIHSHHGRFFNQ